MTTTTPQTLTFPRPTFAKLAPHSYLLAHLNTPSPTRANARLPTSPRPPHTHKGSLTHANGSAVIRIGDTTAVCGVRGEVLLADAVGYSETRLSGGAAPATAATSGTRHKGGMKSTAQELDLLVPNIELATGCAPEFLPGMPPSKMTQELVARVYALLHASALVGDECLKIWGPVVDGEDEEDEEGEKEEGSEVKAFWVLYIDILFISLDGNAFEAAWAALLGALQDVYLPAVRWAEDRQAVVCEDDVSSATRLELRGLPVAVGFAVFRAKEGAGKKGEYWVLIDPDMFEEGLCEETVTVLLDCATGETRLIGVEKVGGAMLGREQMVRLIKQAEKRWVEWRNVLKG
ncbi:hypothetical protein VC83_00060 [Pseudogymnoascus destructans]|uniref:Ribosomal RNA-processing protein 43 n=1 Tax=Pseudogymnoascus destructans TaxID=655981 RepID=A0A177APJ7_9PEZI|nr:uncharacterized protein VC83_00060 [Pseudogymnoascus destructans]OAF63311.1 hypothetical protein VC83_00060 [Pseudogymnoascus destructans]WQG15625.1 hypothetical protein VC83_00060 [Pseudogymnoascus destructans]